MTTRREQAVGIGGIEVERRGQPFRDGSLGASLAALQAIHEARVQPGSAGHRALAQASPFAKRAENGAEAISLGSLGRHFLRSIQAEICRSGPYYRRFTWGSQF